jgi:hypothetical protein
VPNKYLRSSRMTKFRNLVIVLICFFICFGTVTNTANASGTPKKPKPPCRIQIGHAHLSKSVLAIHGVRAVKVNASSICNVPQSKVTLTVEILKYGLFGPQLVARTVTRVPGITYPGKKVDNFNTWKRCKNYEDTRYFGKAFAKAFIQGKWQFASDTYSFELEPLKCGT